MSQLKVNSIVDAAGGSSAVLYGVASPPNSMGFRNRIINGEMRIDQRNNGASVTPTNDAYLVDRWQAKQSTASKFSAQQNAGSVTTPAGFTKYLGCTSLSAFSVGATDIFGIRQWVEGFNTADLGWGTANAQAITIGFWVRSSLTGAFAGSVYNSTGARSYPFSYAISAANTWEYKAVTITGDTTGTWETGNGGGLALFFNLGTGSTYSGTAGIWTGTYTPSVTGAISVVGTSGATFYITGVQLEAGTVATPFERRDYGRELIMCQRYAQQVVNGESTTQAVALGHGQSGTVANYYYQMPVAMRNGPALTYSSLSDFLNDDGVGGSVPATLSVIRSTTISCGISASGLSTVAGRAAQLRANNSSARLLLSSEL